MSNPTMYDKEIWKRMLEKWPDLKRIALKLGIENNPERAREIRSLLYKYPAYSTLCEEERKLAILLYSIEFAEQGFIRGVISKSIIEYNALQYGEAEDTFELALDDFYNSFKDFLDTCKRRFPNLELVTFDMAYEIYLEVIKLKPEEIKPSYIKLFVKHLIKDDNFTRAEIQGSDIAKKSNLLQTILSQELLEDGSN